MSKHIVTRASLTALISREDNVGIQAIGRALVILYDRQVKAEKAEKKTKFTNMMGFTKSDALRGSLTALYFLKHSTLQPWQAEQWRKPNKNGVLKLAKYWRQLDEAAHAKKGL